MISGVKLTYHFIFRLLILSSQNKKLKEKMAKKNWKEFDFTPAVRKKVVDLDGNLIRREYIYSQDPVTRLIQFYESPQNREIMNNTYKDAHGCTPDKYYAQVSAYGDTPLQRARARYIDGEFCLFMGQSIHLISEPGCGKTTTMMTIASGFSRAWCDSPSAPKFDYIFVVSFGERDYEMWDEKNGFVSCFKDALPEVDIRVACLDDFGEESVDKALQILATAQDLVYKGRKTVAVFFDGLTRLTSLASDVMPGDLQSGGLKFRAKQVLQHFLKSGKMFQPTRKYENVSLTMIGSLIVDSNNNNTSTVLRDAARGWCNNHLYLTRDAWEYKVLDDFSDRLVGFTSLDPRISINRQRPKYNRDLSVIEKYIHDYYYGSE